MRTSPSALVCGRRRRGLMTPGRRLQAPGGEQRRLEGPAELVAAHQRPFAGRHAVQEVPAVHRDGPLQFGQRRLGRAGPAGGDQRVLEGGDVALVRPGAVEPVVAVGIRDPAGVAERAPELAQRRVQRVAELLARQVGPQRARDLVLGHRRRGSEQEHQLARLGVAPVRGGQGGVADLHDGPAERPDAQRPAGSGAVPGPRLPAPGPRRRLRSRGPGRGRLVRPARDRSGWRAGDASGQRVRGWRIGDASGQRVRGRSGWRTGDASGQRVSSRRAGDGSSRRVRPCPAPAQFGLIWSDPIRCDLG